MGELEEESIKQTPKLTQAVIDVMNEIDGIEKAMTVGGPGNSYKGVSDRDVKIKIGRAMARHGLVLMPIKVTPKTTIDRYPEVYNGRESGKWKQQVNTEVVTRYKLSHVSGEFDILEGFGMGVDSQDKAAGKATTYAMKYTLLYLFLVPTGDIDDSDRIHSDDIEVPIKINPVQKAVAVDAVQPTQPIQPEPNPAVATGTTTPTPVAPAPEAKTKAKVVKLPAKEEVKTGTPAAGIKPNTEFEEPAKTEQKASDDPRKVAAKAAFAKLDQSVALKYIITDLGLKQYSTVETYVDASSIDDVLKTYKDLTTKK